MDKRREELEEQKADLHLAMLMDEYAERMGKQVREDAEAAFERGELEMPAELEAACRAMISDAPDADKKKKPMRAVTRYALVAALSVALLFGTLIAVQAAGFDIFGSIATWTDSVFHFQTTDAIVKEEKSVRPQNKIQATLYEFGMPVELAPTWFPDGYEVQNVKVSGFNEPVLVVMSVALKEDSPPISVIIKKTNQKGFTLDTVWEKDEQSAELYTVNDRTFFIFENMGTWVGTWCDSEYYISISGVESEFQLKTLLQRIGENTID